MGCDICHPPADDRISLCLTTDRRLGRHRQPVLPRQSLVRRNVLQDGNTSSSEDRTRGGCRARGRGARASRVRAGKGRFDQDMIYDDDAICYDDAGLRHVMLGFLDTTRTFTLLALVCAAVRTETSVSLLLFSCSRRLGDLSHQVVARHPFRVRPDLWNSEDQRSHCNFGSQHDVGSFARLTLANTLPLSMAIGTGPYALESVELLALSPANQT
jgi:hypothetical protein